MVLYIKCPGRRGGTASSLVCTVILLSGAVVCASGGQGKQPVITHPVGEIVVSQSGGRVAFEFYVETAPGSRVMQPASASDLSVGRQGAAGSTWAIIGRTGYEAARVVYGLLPEGFSQYLPERSPPPPLEPGATYSVFANVGVYARATFTYRGDQ